jgi:hypothetical protein
MTYTYKIEEEQNIFSSYLCQIKVKVLIFIYLIGKRK